MGFTKELVVPKPTVDGEEVEKGCLKAYALAVGLHWCYEDVLRY